MTWWRDLGKGYGYEGTFSIHRVECAYCGNQGAFKKLFEQTRQLQTWNVLHYEAYQCNQCGNVTFINWGGEQQVITGRGLHDFRQFPLPTRLKAPEIWPETVASAYLQAEKSLEGES
jgi:ribosomal protein S27E